MSTGKIIIDPKKAEQQSLQGEFINRLNALASNALWRGLTHVEVVGILDSFKFGIQAQMINLSAKPPEEKK